MILALLATIVVVLTVYTYYRFIIKPKQLIAFYKKTFAPYFAIYQYPFTPFQAPQFIKVEEDHKKHKDCFKTMKEVCSEVDLVITNLGDKVQLNLVSPKLMQAFHEVDEEKYYQKYDILVHGLRRMVGNGITFSKGQTWKMKRRVTSLMLNFTYVKSLVPKIYNITNTLIQNIIKTGKPDKDGYIQFNALDLTTDITSTVVFQLFFGGQTYSNQLKIKDRTVNEQIRLIMLLLEKQILNPLAFTFGQKYTKLGVTKMDRQLNSLLADFNQFTRNYITQRLEALTVQYNNQKQYPENYTDLIEAFYVEEILKKKTTITQNFVDSLIGDFATLYTAGTDTTSHAAQMVIYYTALHPNTPQLLREEIAKNIPHFDQLQYDSYKDCTYLQAVITETLRCYTTANGIFPREATSDYFLTIDNDTKIPIKKGTILITSTYPVQYKQSIFQHASEFNPNRFIDHTGKLITPKPFTLMNFSAGARSCIGKQLAMTELRVITSTIFNLYDVKVEDSLKEMVFQSFSGNLQKVTFFIRPKQK